MARLFFLSLLCLPISRSQDKTPSQPGLGCLEPLTALPNSVPVGLNQTGVRVSEAAATADWLACGDSCCHNAACHAALALEQEGGGKCWHISCQSAALCQPISQPNDQRKSKLVLVRTPAAVESEPVTAASLAATVCEVGLDQEQCAPNQVCQPRNNKSRNGVCQCREGFLPAPGLQEGCVAATGEASTSTTSTPLPILPIAVSVANKTIRLPANTANLTAFTVPQSTPDNRFKFEWRLVSSNSLGSEMDHNSDTLKLSGLAEGVYLFKVVVTASSPPGHGEAMANVTVLPAQRLNLPPRAIIVPANQTVTLPTSKAILDGTQSSDDSGSVASYSWEVHSGPLGYQPVLPPVPTLTLENLVAGNYTIKLTVKDEEGESDSALASLLVLEETDYPPKANAGEDKIVYLPQKMVVLNGNQSSDDHDIVSWEWTRKKAEDGQDLPADITGARTPYLTVGNLELGIYTFVLRVTDTAGNSRSDEVTVYVKPPSNYPPVAAAGDDQTYSLPLLFITLDGSRSSDDVNITSVSWSMEEGPRPVIIASPQELVTNVTGLGVGTYVFRLMVSDGNANFANDTVSITVKQDSNQAPVAAIAGLDSGELVLPLNALTLDGSVSTDDLAVERWEWSRDPHSLSAGTVIGNSSQPRLLLTDLQPGTYIFQLQVWDQQGKTDSSRISFTVQEDPARKSAVDMLLDRELNRFTHAELKNFLDTIKILVRADSEVQVELERLAAARRTGFALLTFKVRKVDSTTLQKPRYLSGVEVVSKLSEALSTNPNILGIPVLELETVVCQNLCGGHGVCEQSTRECVCQPFWTENVLSRYILKREPNCDWSVIYVCVVVGGVVVSVLLLCCCLKCRRRRAGSRGQKYARLGTGDIELTGRQNGQLATTTATSESEDEEILFESSKKARRINGLGSRGSKEELINGRSDQLHA